MGYICVLNSVMGSGTTITVGCIFKGVLEIYGTTNKLMIIYPAVVAGLMAAAATV